MPFVDGESLRDRLNRDGQLTLEEALDIARSVATALDYAHRNKIVHRDIKPENIMLNDGEAMVMDFGIAKALTAAGADTLTQVGMVVGTPAYVSPEQAAGEVEIDGRSDQYSLGCVLFEMLSGERPFTGPTAQSVLNKRFSQPVPSLPAGIDGVPDEIEATLSKAMAKDPAARFDTSGAFAKALALPMITTPTAVAVPEGAQAVKSIAVLPFSNTGADPENEYFTDGMAEEIINALSKIKSLGWHRALRLSLSRHDGRHPHHRQEAEVSTVMEGSVRKGQQDQADGAAHQRQHWSPDVVGALRP